MLGKVFATKVGPNWLRLAADKKRPSISIAARLGQYGYENIRNFVRKFTESCRSKGFTNLPEQIYHGQERIIQLSSRPNYWKNDSFFYRSFVRQVSNSYAAQLRRKAATSLMYSGRSAFPMFAFIGISLISGEHQQSSEDKLDEICDLIRASIKKLPWREKSNFESFYDQQGNIVDDYEFNKVIAKGCNAIVYAAKMTSKSSGVCPETSIKNDQEPNPSHFNLAIKMMFNYNAESNTEAILRSMNKEIVPARFPDTNDLFTKFGFGSRFCKKLLSPHPNIVHMSHAFVDYVPSLPRNLELYPDALPIRLNSDGCGRNMTLFLVMKRYHTSLRQYLFDSQLSCRHGLLLFTQLLEGIVHMSRHKVVHRDLKSDNILLYFTEASECPLLVISDFGCCLADPTHGMTLPYCTDEIDKGGNGALMAPEVAKTEPGPRVVINYSKADLWTAGTLAYEIFGGSNPFYGHVGQRLDSKIFKLQDLPPLKEKIPQAIRQLIQLILTPDPKQRPPSEIVATVCHLLLWAPTHWYHFYPSTRDIVEWLVYLTGQVICQQNLGTVSAENQLLSTFLTRVSFKQIILSLSLLQYCCHQ